MPQLRKCKFIVYECSVSKFGTMRSKKSKFGYFHQFSMQYEEFENGAVPYSVGIVEDTDGKVYTPSAADINFLSDEFEMPESLI